MAAKGHSGRCFRSSAFTLTTMLARWTPVYLLSLVLAAAGQSSNVTCRAAYEWTSNSKEQNPCLVSSYLQSLCGRIINVNAIPVGTHYLGPTVQNTSRCSCSSVVYSLTSACGLCQGRTIVDWPEWTINCPEILQSIGRFPITPPDATEIPQWAFLNVTEMPGQQWDPIRARAVAVEPTPESITSTHTASGPTSTIRNSASTSNILSGSDIETSRPTTAVGPGEVSKGSNAGAIAGGVVGGLVGAVGLGLLAFWLLLRKKRKESSAPPQDFVIDEPSAITPYPVTKTNTSPPPMSQRATSPFSTHDYGVSPEPPGSIYRPPSPSVLYTTLTTRRSQESFNVSQFGSQVLPSTRPGAYSGAPEV